MCTESTKVRKDTAIKQLSHALTSFQEQVIGIAKINGIVGMVVDYDSENNYMQVITLLPVGGMIDEHLSADSKYVEGFGLFPDMNLKEMLENPEGYAQWLKDYRINK